MKEYLKGVAVLDVEATSLDTQNGAIASIGMVTFRDGGLKRFYKIFWPFAGAKMEKPALKINGFTLKELNNKCNCKGGELRCKVVGHAHDPRSVPFYVTMFMQNNKCHTIAGQNPIFDMNYINAYFDRYLAFDWFSHRTIDLHSVAYAQLARKNMHVPMERIKDKRGIYHLRNHLSAPKIYKMLGMPTEPSPHNALTGAIFEFEALCRIIYKKQVLREFGKYKLVNQGLFGD